MKHMPLLLAALTLALVATSVIAKEDKGDPARLARYEAQAGEPLKSVPYDKPIKWETVDDQHIVLTMQPSKPYLMRLSGPCLGFSHGSPVVKVSSQAGRVSAGVDRITTQGIMSCRIEEIRSIDLAAVKKTGGTKKGS